SRLSEVLLDSASLDKTLQTLARELVDALSLCRCRFVSNSHLAVETSQSQFVYVAPCCAARRDWIDEAGAGTSPLIRSLLTSYQSLVVDDVQSASRLKGRAQLKSGGVRSLVAAPVGAGKGEPQAILIAERCEAAHTWADREIELIQTVAQQGAIAIRQSSLYREVRESAKRAALISHIITSIRRSLDLDETLKVAVEEIGRAFGADRTYFRKLIGDEFVAVAEYLSDA